MSPVVRMLMNLIPLVLLGLIAWLTVANWSVPVNLIAFGQPVDNLPLGGIIIGAFILGSLSAFIKLADVYSQVRKDLKHHELRKEKAEVQAETSGDKVRALESKIQTLEKALEQALAKAAASRKES